MSKMLLDLQKRVFCPPVAARTPMWAGFCVVTLTDYLYRKRKMTRDCTEDYKEQDSTFRGRHASVFPTSRTLD